MDRFERVEYADGEVGLSGLLVRPRTEPRAAVLVFPTIMNASPAVAAKAHALADAGYVALIADFYGKNPDGPIAFEWADALRSETRIWRRRLHAALEALRTAAPGLPVMAIGFCMGGQAALELARDGADLVAAVSFHGLLDTKAPAEPGAVDARILVCHGDADPLVSRDQVLAFWEEMDRAGANWHFHSYAGVRHGFTNPDPPPNNDVVAYDRSADRQSWSAMLSLFDEMLT